MALEAGNSPQMIFGHYRELVRAMDAEKWFAITPEVVEAVKKRRIEGNGQRSANVVVLPKAAA
jgi:hypothetical protein